MMYYLSTVRRGSQKVCAYNGYITMAGVIVIRFAIGTFKAPDEIHFSVPFYC